MSSSAPPSPPKKHWTIFTPQGVEPPMCLCGDPCRLHESQDISYTYGLRFFMCANYQYDKPPHGSYEYPPSPPPLRDFMQWLDLEQNEHQKDWVLFTMRLRRQAYERREYEQKQDEQLLKHQHEERMRKAAEDRAAAEAREAERERKRERARRAKAQGADALRKGKYPRSTQ